MATKADVVEITQEMATKADVAEITQEMATKADVDEITQVMATKADVAEITQVMATKADVVGVREMIQDKICSDLQKLGKCNFNGLIKDLNKKYLQSTRQWLFEKLDSWFTDKNEDVSNVMILIAGPGVGKSVFAAEVCRRYFEKKKLAASHFCRYNRSDERNPRMLIESLASSMCDTISDFRSKLNEELQRKHSYESVTDAFRVLLHNPLHSLEDYEPMLLVIDALDESQVDGKSELLELIAEEFDRLPKWIKIFITSRPELPVQKEMKDMSPVEITTSPRDENNEEDLHKYLRHELSHLAKKNSDGAFNLLVKKCEGSFLYAYHAQESLKKETELTVENIEQLVPTKLSKFYTEQFKRLNKLLKETILSTHKTVISDRNFTECLEVLVTYESILPLSFLFQCLGFPDDMKFKDRTKIHGVLSQFFPIYDDYLAVYHKSLVDWLKSDGYEEHEFTVDPKNGHKLLWYACEKVFKQIKSMNIFEDQMNTAVIKYALENGIYHMSKCGENVDFSWAVDVKVVCARLMGFEDLNMEDIIKSDLFQIFKEQRIFLRKDVLEELLFHLFMRTGDSYLYDDGLIYLQIIANRIDGSDEKRLLARDLLKQGKFVWFEYLDSTYLTNHHHLTVSLRANVTSLCVSSNEELLAVGYENGEISIFELPEFEERCTLGTALDDSRLDKWDVDTFSSQYDKYYYPTSEKFGFVRGNIFCCSFSPTGKRLVTSDGSTEVKLWDVNNGRLLLCLKSDDVVNRCSFSDFGLFIIAEYVKDYHERPKDVFTAWNSLTLERIDRRCVVDYQEVQYTDKCSEFFVPVIEGSWYVFQFPKAIDIFLNRNEYPLRLHSMIRHHYRDCIYNRTNQNGKLSEITQFCVVPYFSKLKIFKTDHIWRPSFIFDEFEIKCCCFSPDGSFLAAFVVGDNVNIHIWSIERCTIIQTVPMQLKNALGCWWSDGLLWIWDGSDHLMKISTSSENFVDSTQAKHVNIGFKPKEILTFGDVLVCIDEESFVQVVRITKGEIQYNKRLPVDSSKFKAAAVSPDNSVILTVNKTEYTLWKWGNNNNELYLKPWHTAEIPTTSFIEKFVEEQITVNDLKFYCCISDNKQAVITFSRDIRSKGIYVINVHENGDVNEIMHVCALLLQSNLVIHKSYCIGSSSAVDLKSGKVCTAIEEQYFLSTTVPQITIHSNTGTLAFVYKRDCRIRFLKLNVPE
ncbi:uncharacterized protein LOC124456242 [Xenia sp. Carnegie-2017]|uniref:uncharacterized protein LOC124456242 n=1 Tax=Xenia sp. Carnegie-2017 TaxID=2897299 RepID=UPI001F03B09C|nr:uncharacterized protein LOC124456242 [Xenia sp. Carnegie-2017]